MLAQHATQARHSSREIAADKHFAGVVRLQKDDAANGIRQVKHYFGYLDNSFGRYDQAVPGADTFDQRLETALKVYRENQHLQPTGVLGAEAMQLMLGLFTNAQLCVPDMPRWPLTQTHLTYAFVSDDPGSSMLPDAAR